MSEAEKKRGWWPSLVIWEVVTLGLGALNGLLTSGRMGVYESLRKPPLSPPGWVFPVVWGILYAAMALSAWLVWRENTPGRRGWLALWAAQLAVNLAWPWLFFVLQAFGLAFVWLVVLWALTGFLMFGLLRQQRVAGWLLIPYLLWLTFAGYLSFMVARLNP